MNIHNLLSRPCLRWTLAGAVASLVALGLSVAAWADDEAKLGEGAAALGQALDKILSDELLKDATVGVHVRNLSNGDTLYGRNQDKAFNPASNIKLVTAAAALDRLGPAWTWTTEVHSDRLKGSKINGDLYLKGGGDPFLLWSHLLELAERTRREGITEITGDLVIDDTCFDDQFVPPAFEQKSEDAAYRATVGCAAVEFSSLTVEITGRKPGEKPRITFDPPNDYARVESKATTADSRQAARDKPIRVSSVSKGDRTVIKIEGSVAPGKSRSFRKRIDNPSLYTGYVFRRALKLLGVKVQGKIRRGTTPDKATLIARHASPALSYSAAAMQKWSNNFMAEMIFKSLDAPRHGEAGAPASWKGAQDKLRAFLIKAGVKGADTLKLSNGSGLYDANALSPAQFTQVLYYLQSRPDILPEFETSFAIAGVDGTLAKRMREGAAHTTLRGKTGTLRGVVTITGTVQTPSGHRLGYSILFNNARGGAWPYRRLQDKLCHAIAAWKGP